MRSFGTLLMLVLLSFCLLRGQSNGHLNLDGCIAFPIAGDSIVLDDKYFESLFDTSGICTISEEIWKARGYGQLESFYPDRKYYILPNPKTTWPVLIIRRSESVIWAWLQHEENLWAGNHVKVWAINSRGSLEIRSVITSEGRLTVYVRNDLVNVDRKDVYLIKPDIFEKESSTDR